VCYIDHEKFFPFHLTKHTDDRGSFVEVVKPGSGGQVSFSTTKPGITRGNHFHHTKAEKFLVLEGEAVIRFRKVQNSTLESSKSEGSKLPEVLEYRVSGRDFRVLDIPPGYTHNIENIGDTELITLFWASEIFDPENPDTFYEGV
jgi:UDP-2-acetamido-2,6-beta-L-arabino-hexul-4-ose reductase